MDSPQDVNSSQMRAVYGNRLRLDNPLLGDNPKVVALKREQSDTNIKTLIDEALKKFFFPDPPEETDDLGAEDEPETPKSEEKSDPDLAGVSMLVSLFKMLAETVFKNKGGNK